MNKEKGRISKPPEERKQDIIDAAMRVFTEKGYEQTTMRDIAAVIDVVPGLCYRYFKSKQELFEHAVQQYVAEYCAPVIQAMQTHSGDMDGLLSCLTELFIKRDGKEKYHEFFHKEENKTFHILLFYSNCEYLLPYVKKFFDRLNENGTTSIPDTNTLSQFMLFGQIPIMSDESLPIEQKLEIIKEYLIKLMK